MRTKVLLFGGTSYVGQFLVQALLDADVEVVAIAHNLTSARILLAKQLGSLRLVSHEEAMRAKEADVAAVINLAYVKSASPHRANRENESLIRSVHEAAVHHRCERVIHASTIAVFGYEPVATPMPTPVPVLPGNFYIETKARAEHMLLRRAAGGSYHLAIVRLGNVLGPGSPAWTANLAQRLLEGKPLETQKSLGCSNATYVENAASYLCHLSGLAKAELDRFGTYHHVVEFGDHPWDDFLAGFERAVGLGRVKVEASPAGPGPSLSHLVGTTLKQAYRGRMGTYARSLLGRVPWVEALDAALARVKNLDAPETHLRGAELVSDDLALLGLLESKVRVTPHTVPTWTPPVGFEAASDRMATWLRESGYAVRTGA